MDPLRGIRPTLEPRSSPALELLLHRPLLAEGPQLETTGPAQACGKDLEGNHHPFIEHL